MTETTPSPLSHFITIDDELIKNQLDRVVRGSVEETLNAMLDAEADRLCNATLRAQRSPSRHVCRPLRAQAADQGRRGKAADTEASGADLRDGDHRALPAARELGR